MYLYTCHCLYKVNCDSVSYKAENTAIFEAYNRMHCWLVRCGGIIHNTYLSFVDLCFIDYRGYVTGRIGGRKNAFIFNYFFVAGKI